MKIRKAQEADLPSIVGMLANDMLGKLREDFSNPLPETYYQAFEKIDNDDNHELMVMENDDQEIIGTLQLTFIQYLTYQGGIRAQIEGVRIRDDYTGKGIGKQLLTWAINRAKEKGAHVVQLTSNNKRQDAIRFYEQVGFTSSHAGMKLHF